MWNVVNGCYSSAGGDSYNPESEQGSSCQEWPRISGNLKIARNSHGDAAITTRIVAK